MELRKKQVRDKNLEAFKKDSQIFMESEYSEHHLNGQALDSDLEALNECIEKLNEDQKKCVSMFYLDQKCYQEISNGLGYDLKKVKSYIQNGKRNLKICIEKKHESSE